MDYTEIIITVITAIIVPGLIWAVKKADTYISEKIKDDKLEKYFKIACDSVQTAVKEVSQVYVDKLQDRCEWTEETKKNAFTLAKYKSIEIMGITAKTIIEESLGDFDTWIESKIEAAVKEGE